MVNPGSEQPQLCAARNSVTGILRWDEKVDPRSRIALSYQ